MTEKEECEVMEFAMRLIDIVYDSKKINGRLDPQTNVRIISFPSPPAQARNSEEGRQ